MDPRSLVRALEPEWQPVLDAVLAERRLPRSTDVARLGPKLAQLSSAYNSGLAQGTRTKLPVEARLAFSFPRDVPKGAAAVRELVASGALALPAARPLRVIDLGAGLGAMTWGLVRALAASGAKGAVDALLVDEDAEALAVASAIGRAAQALPSAPAVRLAITTRTASLLGTNDGSAGALGGGRVAPADVVFLGQVLSEIEPPGPAPDEAALAARATRHAELVERVLAEMVAPDGSLVIVEPALRDRTRHLHAVRDRLLERGLGTVFAPCLHARACPALPVEGEWCHEDLAVDLPPWVVPLARAAGLRWQGLTFSYLVLRRDGRTLFPEMGLGPGPGGLRFRAISDLLRSKGKTEVFACTTAGERARLRLLDRDAGRGHGVPFDELRRGDIVTLRPGSGTGPVDERGRVAGDVAIDVAGFRK